MTLTLFALWALFAATFATTEVYHLEQIDGEGRVVNMDVHYDKDAKTVMAIIGDVSMYENGIQTVNLHDYNWDYGVLKNINKKICLLTKPLVKMQPAWKYRMGKTYEVHAHNLHINPTKMSRAEVLALAGPTIATFCHDYGTYYAVATPANDTADQYLDAMAAEQDMAASWCIFSWCGTTKDKYDQLA